MKPRYSKKENGRNKKQDKQEKEHLKTELADIYLYLIKNIYHLKSLKNIYM